MGYDRVMEPLHGRVENGAIVLDDPTALVEGAPVTVWLGDGEPVAAHPEELDLVDRGRAAAQAGRVLDARDFLRALRGRG